MTKTDRYITNVCDDASFNNVANFNRRFLELKGMAPNEFRQQVKARFGRSVRDHAAMYLGIDRGTSELKLLLLSDRHVVRASTSVGLSIERAHALSRELPDLTEITGNLAMPGFTAPKRRWIRDHEPALPEPGDR